MKVQFIYEVDIDCVDLSPKYVNIEQFAKEEALRVLKGEITSNVITSEDFDLIKESD